MLLMIQKNHIHWVVSISPTLAISDFVKKIKGSSSHYLNNVLSLKENKFAWQAGYGVFSLGQTQLERAIAYVDNQKQHLLNDSFHGGIPVLNDSFHGKMPVSNSSFHRDMPTLKFQFSH